jgi:hypothetical protein
MLTRTASRARMPIPRSTVCGCGCRSPSLASRSDHFNPDVGGMTAEPYQPSRLSKRGEARHHRRHELASRTERRRLEAGPSCDARQTGQARLAALRRLPAQPHDRARRARPAPSARHADAAPHDLKGDAVHALWGAEGMLLARAAQHQGWDLKRTPGGGGCALTGAHLSFRWS